MGQSSHVGHVEVPWVSDFETCGVLLKYSLTWRHEQIFYHNSNLKHAHSNVFLPNK